MFRSRSWFGGGWGRPKNPHSLEHLKYLYNVLARNQTVSEHNRGLLVESLRCIAEILIWGDQNDSSVFDFFLEKNMLSFFLRIMKQRSGGSSYVCVQLLQTLNILFENIRNETSLYYLLSNNHVNSIIVHKFDFSDEEVMAYYISFLKTLSLKLNSHTIHFFYNEHTNDFPLYTEAIKFFNHSESMVRIAVRTLTLNVYRVEDASMLGFIRDRTAAPYFSNIVWFIGKHILELDTCVRSNDDHQSYNRLSDLVAEHLDHLHYLNDILCLNIIDLNKVLTEHLLYKLFIPLYIYSLTDYDPQNEKQRITAISRHLANILKNTDSSHEYDYTSGRVSCVVTLFLLSQVFLIINHAPLVKALAWIIFKADASVFETDLREVMENYFEDTEAAATETASQSEDTKPAVVNGPEESANKNITDEEKEKIASLLNVNIAMSPFLEKIIGLLDCSENDYNALFALSLLYALANNKGIPVKLLEVILKPKLAEIPSYNIVLVDKLLQIVNLSCQPVCRVRLVTLELCLKLLVQLVVNDGQNLLIETHKTAVESVKAQSTALLRNFYKSEEIFLDMFEHEYCDMSKGPLNVEWLCMDSALLLPPTGTPLTGIAFTKRLPCGEVERARRAIRVFFLIRNLHLMLTGEPETQLPLTNPDYCIQVNTALDLNNSDLIACTVVWKDGQKTRKFLVIDVLQLILVEPDTKKLGWGVAKLVGFLQDIEVTGDKDDSRCLHITIHRPLSSNTTPLLSAKFIFDDHIRCMAARQRLTKGRIKARQKKMQHIARLLEIPGQTGPPSPAHTGLATCLQRGMNRMNREHRPLFATGFGPGIATLRRDSMPGSFQRLADSHNARLSRDKNGSSALANGIKKDGDRNRERRSSNSKSRDSSSGRTMSREGSPRMPRPRSEEIQLELIKSPNLSNEQSPKISILPRPQVVKAELESSSDGLSKTEGVAGPSQMKSEETSFISQEERKTKRKGVIETI